MYLADFTSLILVPGNCLHKELMERSGSAFSVLLSLPLWGVSLLFTCSWYRRIVGIDITRHLFDVHGNPNTCAARADDIGLLAM